MKVTTLVALFVLAIGPVGIADADEPIRAIFRVQISTEKSSRSHTVMFSLADGSAKYFGTEFPTLKVLVLPTESEVVQLQLSLVDENKQALSSTVIEYAPESIAEFSVAAEGLRAEGTVSTLPE
jgi:hypothetical protein